MLVVRPEGSFREKTMEKMWYMTHGWGRCKKITSIVQFTLFWKGEKNKMNSKSFQCITGDSRFLLEMSKKFLEDILRFQGYFLEDNFGL
jgi:hypothetical protein